MRSRSRFQKLIPLLLLGGCSAAVEPPPQPAPPAKTVFDPLLHSEDRARAVQGVIDQNAADTRKRIDAESEGSDAPK
jgi:hypothetical protein